MLTTQILYGRDINQRDLDRINEYRKIRLDRDNVWDHLANNFFHSRLFFLVRDNSELVAFGVLKLIEVFIGGQKIDIQGIQSIISIVQGKGYGKALIHNMINYAKEKNLILVGFCEPHNSEFYQKSGLEVFPGKNTSFIHEKENGETYTEEGDVIYFSGSNDIIKTTLLAGKEIRHKVSHW